MNSGLTRRSMLAGSTAAVVLGSTFPVQAQAKTKLRFSATFTEADMRADAYKAFAIAIKDDFGANPTPVAYAELYTALQTGTVDGQDNPLVNSKLMKFDEVTSQFVLTRHVIGYDVMVVRSKIWDALKPDQQAGFQAAADKTMSESMDKFNAQEAEVIDYFKKAGKKVYEPDQNAFRTFAQKRYVEKYGNDWPKGALERINAVK